MPEIMAQYMSPDLENGEDFYDWVKEYDEWLLANDEFDVDEFADYYFDGQVPA